MTGVIRRIWSMKSFLFFILTLLTTPAFATIWITIGDPSSQKIGVVGASSGNIGDYRTMVPVDNTAIAVVGSWYLGKKQKHLTALLRNRAMTAHEVAKEFSRLINLDSHKRRVSLVNARFENASEPGRGCHRDNNYCGKYEDPHFTITGGGLVSENVINAGRDALLSAEHLPFECRMYLGIKAIFHSGGEFKKINRLAYIVDDIRVNGDNRIHLFHRKGHENNLLDQFHRKLTASGIQCPL